MSIRILFICTGNITLSEMAEGLARALVEESSEGSGTTETAPRH
jgi:protein-tyrosine-phosphatase